MVTATLFLERAQVTKEALSSFLRRICWGLRTTLPRKRIRKASLFPLRTAARERSDMGLV